MRFLARGPRSEWTPTAIDAEVARVTAERTAPVRPTTAVLAVRRQQRLVFGEHLHSEPRPVPAWLAASEAAWNRQNQESSAS